MEKIKTMIKCCKNEFWIFCYRVVFWKYCLWYNDNCNRAWSFHFNMPIHILCNQIVHIYNFEQCHFNISMHILCDQFEHICNFEQDCTTKWNVLSKILDEMESTSLKMWHVMLSEKRHDKLCMEYNLNTNVYLVNTSLSILHHKLEQNQAIFLPLEPPYFSAWHNLLSVNKTKITGNLGITC